MACGWFAGDRLEVLPTAHQPDNHEMYAPPNEIDIYEPLSVRVCGLVGRWCCGNKMDGYCCRIARIGIRESLELNKLRKREVVLVLLKSLARLFRSFVEWMRATNQPSAKVWTITINSWRIPSPSSLKFCETSRTALACRGAYQKPISIHFHERSSEKEMDCWQNQTSNRKISQHFKRMNTRSGDPRNSIQHPWGRWRWWHHVNRSISPFCLPTRCLTYRMYVDCIHEAYAMWTSQRNYYLLRPQVQRLLLYQINKTNGPPAVAGAGAVPET